MTLRNASNRRVDGSWVNRVGPAVKAIWRRKTGRVGVAFRIVGNQFHMRQTSDKGSRYS